MQKTLICGIVLALGTPVLAAPPAAMVSGGGSSAAMIAGLQTDIAPHRIQTQHQADDAIILAVNATKETKTRPQTRPLTRAEHLALAEKKRKRRIVLWRTWSIGGFR